MSAIILTYITMRGKLNKAAQRMGLTDEEFNEHIESLVEKLSSKDADKLVEVGEETRFSNVGLMHYKRPDHD